MLDLSEPTSRRAASDDTEYASRGASMICSTYHVRLDDWMAGESWLTYDGLEVSNLEGRVIRGHLRNLVVLCVHLW